MRLADKAAVVTGAAGDIGRAIALELAREGARVAVSDPSFLAAEDLSDKIKARGGKALPVEADPAVEADMARLFDQAASSFGRLDIAVHSAELRRDALLETMTEAQWAEVLSVQLTGGFHTARFARPFLARQGGGRILFVAAPAPAGLGEPGQANFAAANAGLAGLTRALAIELGRYNITVNCLAPDFIETKTTREAARRQGLYMDDYKKAVLARIPLRRLGTVEDVARVAVFLASDDAAYVSGQVLYVRGGP